MSVRIESQAEPVPGYRLLDRLGSGGFGEVWRAQAPGGIFKAIKIIHGDLRNRDNDAYRFAEQELKAMKRVQQVRHPYLLAIDRYDIIEGRLLITMELADCNLWDRFRVCRKEGLPGIPREELLRYMSESAEVLDLFNDKFQLQHLDIKPQNLFMLHDHVKVADFGQVKDLENHMAQVTGGITPVYAAPETFDGFVSRFCDQYSLACVYQELLTGIRPFDGSSMQQLLMQHLQMAPNLNPTPPGERAALAKALSKQPSDRFDSVGAMVAAIREGGNRTSVSVATPMVSHSLAAQPKPYVSHRDAPSDRIELELSSATELPGLIPTGLPPSIASTAATYDRNLINTGMAAKESTPYPDPMVETSPPIDRQAPAEITGTGSLRPTLVVGLGYTGMLVLQRLRKQVGDRFGSPDKLPVLRTLYIDTDPDALAHATLDQPSLGLAGLSPENVVPAKLQRAAHYLKPRVNGRTVLEGWFDPQWLYKMPRNPMTMGLRSFGRLAFVDHFRTVLHRLQGELEIAIDPQAMTETQLHTGLEMATNRPRVYVVAGLGGGTGSGMLIDAAYTLRYRLRKLGYTDPEVIGLLLTPPDAPGVENNTQAQANTYATLTELHHYSRNGTQFSAYYDERTLPIRDAEPPFSRVFLVPGLAYPYANPAGSQNVTTTVQPRSGPIGYAQRTPQPITFPNPRGSGSLKIATRRSGPVGLESTRRPEEAQLSETITHAADFLRLELFSQVGPLLNEVRPPATSVEHGCFVQTYGLKRFDWPRAEVLGRNARTLNAVLVNQWVSPDPTHIRQTIPAWAQDQWTRSGLDMDTLSQSILTQAENTAGVNLAQMFALGTENLLPKGWLARSPDAEKTAVVLEQWIALIGRPNSPVGRAAIFQEALADQADAFFDKIKTEHTLLFPNLIEAPAFRLAGTEEAIRQVLSILDRSRIKSEQIAIEREAEAQSSIELLSGHANNQRGTRKLSSNEFSEAIQKFPQAQLQYLQAKAISRVYRKLKDVLVAFLSEVTGFRQRIEAGLPELAAEADIPANPALPGEFLPTGCASPEEAAQVFLKSLTDDDLHDLDLRVQEGLERKFGGLYEACLNSTEGHSSIFKVLKEQTRAYLESRLGEVDFAGMLFTHFGGKHQAAAGLYKAYDEAMPKLVGNGPWSQKAIDVYVGPNGAGGDPIREIAAEILPEGTIDSQTFDEVVIYREFSEVPLVAVPQLGPLWSNAYQAFPDIHQATPHTRLDVTTWTDVDSTVG
jgi:eukaryotic-like serine/threonine-protein kinase